MTPLTRADAVSIMLPGDPSDSALIGAWLRSLVQPAPAQSVPWRAIGVTAGGVFVTVWIADRLGIKGPIGAAAVGLVTAAVAGLALSAIIQAEGNAAIDAMAAKLGDSLGAAAATTDTGAEIAAAEDAERLE